MPELGSLWYSVGLKDFTDTDAYSGEDHPAFPAITTQFFKHEQSLCAGMVQS